MPKKPAAPQKANIGVAMIAYNAEATLQACLASFAPYVRRIVVCVDERTTDKTALIARRFGCEVHPIKVSDWHECPQHGRILAQDFAKARNESFGYFADSDVDALMWVDADDVIEHAEQLPALLANMPEPCIGSWHPYIYSHMLTPEGWRQVNTLFHRERLLRTHYRGQRVQWVWENRVHEVVLPRNVDHPQWLQNESVVWVHQHQAHKTEVSAPRNLTLLEIELEDDPESPRTNFYMGNQYFAMSDWFNAVQWYERRTRLELPKERNNPYEVWQSYVYMSLAYERMGDMSASLSAAFGALDTLPQHPEPYWRLAALYAQTEQPEKCVYWTQRAEDCVEAPFFAFKNPMDHLFNRHLPLADSYLQMGDIAKATATWKTALQAFPDEHIKGRAEWGEAKLAAEEAASDFMRTARFLDREQTLAVYDKLPDSVKRFGRARNVMAAALRQRRRERVLQSESKQEHGHGNEDQLHPEQLPVAGVNAADNGQGNDGKRRDPHVDGGKGAERHPAVAINRGGDILLSHGPSLTQPTIVFFCPGSWEPWAPPSVNTTGIGGSETAVMEIAKRFARAGWLVDVYGNPDWMEGEHDGVGYWDIGRWDDAPCDVFVGWRRPDAYGAATKAKQRVLWCHDLNYGPDAAEAFQQWDKVLGVSEWHANRLALYYGVFVLPDSVPNGIDVERFDLNLKKVPFRCVFASSPDRGLLRLLNLWPSILRTEPEAELHVAYGWDTTDKMIARGNQHLAEFKDRVVKKLETSERVVWRGRLNQAELATLYGESALWLYPTDFLEVSCISAMEAMAGGAVPITTRCGALSETLGDAGFLVPGPTTSRGYTETFLNVARGALTDETLRRAYANAGRLRAATLTWDQAFARWLDVLGVDPGQERPIQGADASVPSHPCPSDEPHKQATVADPLRERTVETAPQPQPVLAPACDESTAVAA